MGYINKLFIDSFNIYNVEKILIQDDIRYKKQKISDDKSAKPQFQLTIYSEISIDAVKQILTNADIKGFHHEYYNNADDFKPDFEEYDDKEESQQQFILYPSVKRGEVYLCDFKSPSGYLPAYKRYAIVVSDSTNEKNMTATVIPCTTSSKYNDRFGFVFSSLNMTDYSTAHVSGKKNFPLFGKVTNVEKQQLINYLGSLTPEYMKTVILPKLEKELGFNTLEKTEETVKSFVIPNTSLVITKKQQSLLVGRNIQNILNISSSDMPLDEKIGNFLSEFGFQLSQSGINLVSEMIESAYTYNSVTSISISALAKIVAEPNSMDPKEVERITVARIKETFKVSKSPAIDFIRLAVSLLKLGG